MSIDKFGRHRLKRLRGPKGPKGDGFDLTPEGDYDVQSKRLRHVHIPMENSDAVNMLYMNQLCLASNSPSAPYDAKGKVISRVNSPKEADDVVTLRYFQEMTPRRFKDSFGFHNSRLKNIGKPIDEKDAVHISYLNEHCLQYGLTNAVNPHIDARRRLIRNVNEPEIGADAATKRYVDTKTPGGNQYEWEMRGRRLTNCGHPVESNDAVTLGLFKSGCPKVDALESCWKFSNYRLTDVAEPHDLDDAVTKRYLKSALIQFGESLVKTAGVEVKDSFKTDLEQTFSNWP